MYTQHQAWAGYPEGDKIPTKIGTGRVEIGIGMTFYPDLSGFIEIGMNQGKSRVGDIEIRIETSRDASGKIEESGKIEMISTFPDSPMLLFWPNKVLDCPRLFI